MYYNGLNIYIFIFIDLFYNVLICFYIVFVLTLLIAVEESTKQGYQVYLVGIVYHRWQPFVREIEVGKTWMQFYSNVAFPFNIL